MRKITLTLACILGLGTLSQAQVLAPLKMDIHPDQKNIVEPSRPSLENPRRDDASGWFSHLNAYSAFNGFSVAGNTFVSWLFPDTAKIINSDGSSRRVYFSTTGSTFDPKDPVFFNSPAQFSRFTTYTWDSLSWLQFYIRNSDSMIQEQGIQATAYYDVVDYTALAGVTAAVDGVDLVEGTDWTAETSNEVTAANLAAAINNIELLGLKLYPSTSTGNRVNITFFIPGTDGNDATIASSDATNLMPSGSNFTGGGIEEITVEVVDTLFVQYFTSENTGITFGSYSIGGTGSYQYGVPRPASWSQQSLMNSAAFKVDTVLLTGEFADSLAGTQIFGRGLATSIGQVINGGNTLTGNDVAATFTFKPMTPYTINDTLLSFNTSAIPAKKHNLLGVRMAAFDGHTYHNSNPEAINHSLISNHEVRYGQNLFNFLRVYIPGNLFGNSVFHDNFYHLTTNNLSTSNPSLNGYALGNAYPNPTSGASNITIPFTLGAGQNVTFTLSDVTGKQIKTVTKSFEAGENSVSFDVSNLNTGVYFYTMNTSAFKSTGRVLVK